jgi:hypothetical protein
MEAKANEQAVTPMGRSLKMEDHPWKVVDDFSMLATAKVTTPKVRRIIALWDETKIISLQMTYFSPADSREYSSNLARPEKVKPLQKSELVLDYYEYLTDIIYYFDHDNELDGWFVYMEFMTSKQRILKAGVIKGKKILTRWTSDKGSHFSVVSCGYDKENPHVVGLLAYEQRIDKYLENFKHMLSVEETNLRAFHELNKNDNSDKHPFFNLGAKGMNKKSIFSGVYVSGSKAFDHFQENFKDEFFEPNLTELTIFCDENYIVGLRCSYANFSRKFEDLMCIPAGTNLDFAGSMSIELEFGERIESFSGSFDTFMTGLNVITSRGKRISIGTFKGRPFPNIIEPDCVNIRGFGGSIGEGLECLYFYYC